MRGRQGGYPQAAVSARAVLSRIVAGARRHPDAVALVILLAVGGAIRLALQSRAPAFFVGGDSQTYLLPAYELVRDGDWDMGARRPPGYPLFVAAAIALFGEDPRALAAVQHGLGLLVIACTYGIGRSMAGRAAGFLAGLGVALSGPLLVYERYVMAEALFTLLLGGSVLALLAARGSGRGGWLAFAGGLVLALGWLVRPSALLLAPIVPLAFVGGRPWRQAAALSGLAVAGFLVVAVPWSALTLARYEVIGSVGIGNTLVWRVTREEPALIGQRDSWPSREGDALAPARRYAFGLATRRELPDDIADAVQARFGLSEVEADRVLAAVAVEAIRARPADYLRGTADLTWELFVGIDQPLGGQGKEGGIVRYPDPREKYGSWWNERIRHIPQPPTATEAAEFGRARALVGIFRPHRVGGLLLGLCLAGLAAGLLAPRYRGALLVAAAILVSLVGSTALAGSFPRFRYPLDPLILALAAAGVVAALDLLRATARRLAEARSPKRAPDAAGWGRARTIRPSV